MKRVLVSIVAFSLLATSCETTPPPAPPRFKVVVISENVSGIMDITVAVQWKTSVWVIDGEDGIGGFSVTFTNQTAKSAKVVWEQSSLSYNGRSFTPFLEGQKYEEASRPLSPTVVPAKGTITKAVFSSGQPFYSRAPQSYDYKWRMGNITASDVSILLCIQSGDIEDYYSILIEEVQP